MTNEETRYVEQQLFQVAPLPLYEPQHYPYGFDLRIRCSGGDDRAASSSTNWLKITPDQMQKIERVLLGDA
jgi:hypothetical protein